MEVLERPTPTQHRTDAEDAFEELYEHAFTLVAKFVSKMGGSFSDAKDIFHDAFLIYYEKDTAKIANIQVASEVYILGIAKHLWLRKYQETKGKVTLDQVEQVISVPEDFYQENEDNNRLLLLLQLTGRKCLELLRAFYYDKFNLAEITGLFGYQNVRSATVQKYKCLEKVRDKVKEKSLGYEDLL